jgi:PAS domain S-box-containing protein
MGMRLHPTDDVHFQAVIEQLPVVVYIDRLDEHSTAAYVSPQIEAMTGYPPADFVRDPKLFLELVHPDDRDFYLAMIARRNSENVPASGEYRLITRDGRVIWVLDHERVVLDIEGQPLYAQGYLIDATERRGERVRLEAINAVLTAYSDGLLAEDVVARGLAALTRALPGLRISFIRADGGERLHVLASNGNQALPAMSPGTLAVGEAHVYLGLLRAGEKVESERGSRADLFGGVFSGLGGGDTASFVDVPVRRGSRLLGVLCVDSPLPRAFTADEVQILKEVGHQLAVVLDRDGARLELRRRDEILSTVSRAAAVILAGSSWEAAAPGLLESLGNAAHASRAYIFEVSGRTAGELRASQRFEWVSTGVTAELGNPDLQDMAFADHDLGVMAEAVLRNEVYAGLVRDLGPRGRALLEPQGVRSLLEVPITVDGRPWGFIGFDDCVENREWSEAEIDALRAAASLVGSSVVRERREATLREQEQRLRANFEAALDAIFVTDSERQVVDVNAAAAAMLGLERDELVGRRVDDFMPPHRLATLEADWAAFLAATTIEEEWELQRADGVVLHVQASARPNFLPGLNIAFVRDVTEPRRLEARLRDSQRLESIGRLAGGVAHDFNNLLTAIGGYTNLARDRVNGDVELAGDLAEIQRAADRAADLTRQLLAFGRRQVLQAQPIELNEAVREVESMLRRLIGEDISLLTRLDPTVGTVLADPGQLEQVIVNLAVNARDAMPVGGTITISTHRATRQGRPMLALEVADTGVGMDDETRTHAFEPFFTTRSEGVGLGLASVYGIVTQSHGEIDVASELGRGTTFTVLLPQIDDTPPQREAPEEPGCRRGSGTVLLVEDEDVVRALARRVLEQHGYQVLESRNGHEAIGIAETYEGAIDVLLTDVVMPGLRGHEAADRIALSRPGIPVVYMSGYADEALLGRAADGGSHFLEKPFSNDALARRIGEALEATAATAR